VIDDDSSEKLTPVAELPANENSQDGGNQRITAMKTIPLTAAQR
jgi:hypothetical protein